MFWVASAILASLAYRSLLFWKPGSDHVTAIEGWFFLPTNTSPRLVLALTLLLVHRRRDQIRAGLVPGGAPGLALLPLLAGVALYFWSIHTGATDLLVASLALAALGACLLAGGQRLARALAFPLLILLFAIPLPAVLTNQLFYDLQHWTARETAFLLPLLGTPVFREGNAIYAAHGQFQVVDTCAGLRFIEVLTLLAVAWAAWLPTGRLRTVLRIALAVPIAYGFNILRVCLLILYPSSPLTSMHIIQGWSVFLGAVVCLAYLDRLVLGRLPSRRLATEAPDAHRAGERVPDLAAPALTTLLAAVLCAAWWIPRWEVPAHERLAYRNLPARIEGWRMTLELPLDRTFLASTRFTTHVYRAMERAGETVFVFVGYDDRMRRDRSFRTPKNAFVDAGWEVEERERMQPDPDGPAVESVLARSRERRLLSLTWYANTGSLCEEVLRAFLALDQSPLRRPGGGRVVRISTPAGVNAEEVAAARARLLALAPAIETALEHGRASTTGSRPRGHGKALGSSG